MIRELKTIVKEMSPLKEILPKEIVIGKLIFDYPQQEVTQDTQIHFNMKERKRGQHSIYQVLYSESSCLRQGVFFQYNETMLKAEGKNLNSDVDVDIAIELENVLCISWDEIQTFVKQIGDDNPIHGLERAIVPGLMVLNILLEEIERENKDRKWQCSARFIQPLYANEGFVLSVQGTKYKVETISGKEILSVTLEEKL